MFFFFNDSSTTEIYTLSLHDALPISRTLSSRKNGLPPVRSTRTALTAAVASSRPTKLSRRTWAFSGESGRSEEHTSELQSLTNLVCRLLLEKKKNRKIIK